MKTATGLIAWYIRWRNCEAMTFFWGTYALPGSENKKDLIAHEAQHAVDMRNEGRIKYTIKYFWYWITVGYQNNPYEIRAREAGAKALK